MPSSRQRVTSAARKSTSSRGRTAAVPTGAVVAEKPGFIDPCLATLHSAAPKGGEWLGEIKYDGYRAQAHLNDDEIHIYTRRGYDWSERFAAITKAFERIKLASAILDGEVVVLDAQGISDYHKLQEALAQGRSERLVFVAFDLLYWNGYDLRQLPLIERKRLLGEILRESPTDLIRLSDHIEAEASALFSHACAMHLEGIMLKDRDSAYRSGRQESWIKLKCLKSDTFPIIAFVEKLGARPRRIASLYLGRREGDQLLYAGKAQTGFKTEMLYELRERLDPYIRQTSPLSVPVKKPKATWVEPVVQAEIEYSAMTSDKRLRAPVYKGIREDLTEAGHAPRRSTTPRVPKENILQLLPDAVVPSKDELRAYWTKVADRALKYLARRPLKLVRHTRGTTFYHKGRLPPVPASVHELRIQKREGGEGTRLWVEDLEGLLGLVEIGAVELHPWNSTVDDLEHPDLMVFDLDPGPGVEWDFLVHTAFALRDLLKADGLSPWPKLTGGKGVHLMVPLAGHMTHDQAHRYSRSLAERIVSDAPDRYTTAAATAQRAGRLFLDYLRNGRGTTAVGTYSPRVRRGFPIAAPTTWPNLERGIQPDAFTMAEPFGKVRRRNSRGKTEFPEVPLQGAKANERRQKPARRARQQTH